MKAMKPFWIVLAFILAILASRWLAKKIGSYNTDDLMKVQPISTTL